MHKLFKTLSALSTNEINDFTSYILNEKLTSASASRKLHIIIIRNLSKWLKGHGIFATKKQRQQKQNKKNYPPNCIEYLSELKYMFKYEYDCTFVVCVPNWKRFKKDFEVSFATMNL